MKVDPKEEYYEFLDAEYATLNKLINKKKDKSNQPLDAGQLYLWGCPNFRG